MGKQRVAAVALVLCAGTAFGQGSRDRSLREARACRTPPQAPYTGRSLWNANLWTGGVVPYEFDANTTADDQTAMRQAMDALEAVANVHFVPRAGEANYLHISDYTGNYSYVGMIGNMQPVGIFNWNYRYIMCHELMHALGLWHEQSRPDRDQYITVNYDQIQPDWRSQYDIQPGPVPEGPYDFDSVMHYGPCDASICCAAGATCGCAPECSTMTTMPPYAGSQGLMGQRTHLSAGDISGLVSRYGALGCPTFTQQPLSEAAGLGLAVSLSVAAVGTDPPTYQWQHAGATLADDGRITGSRTANLTINPVTATDAGAYDCVATNSCGSTVSAAATISVSCQPSWQTVGAAGPGARYASGMVFDAARAQLVLFGGGDGAAEPNDISGGTWTFDGSSWRLAAATGAGARDSQQMVYDSARQRLVMFGGRVNTPPDPAAYLADTWEWDGAAWTQVFPAHAPPARSGGAMAYDAARQRVVLFGGGAGPSAVYGDLWEYDGNDWTQRTFGAAVPGPRTGARMVYDTPRGVCVMVGGSSGADLYPETWEFDGTVWTLRAASLPGVDPSAMVIAYDSARHLTIVTDGALGALREWDGTAWRTLAPAGAPAGARPWPGIAYDPVHDALVVQGGANRGNAAWQDTLTLACPSPAWWIGAQPQSTAACNNGTAAFSVSLAGGPPGLFGCSWQVRVGTEEWLTLGADPAPLACGGAASADAPASPATSIRIEPCPGVTAYSVRCVVSTACCSLTSGEATYYSICPGCCYANCDGSVSPPVLNVADFTCFLQKFAAGDPYANCDQSTTPPVLNVGDFSCFLEAYAAGCP
jgi:hypothetical protein